VVQFFLCDSRKVDEVPLLIVVPVVAAVVVNTTITTMTVIDPLYLVLSFLS